VVSLLGTLFLKKWFQTLITDGKRERLKMSRLSMSEVMTIMILFHQSNYRTLKHFYLRHVCLFLKEEFPNLVSYSQFVRLQKECLIPLCAYLNSRRGEVIGLSYIALPPLRFATIFVSNGIVYLRGLLHEVKQPWDGSMVLSFMWL
jgi:hypothetical protein